MTLHFTIHAGGREPNSKAFAALVAISLLAAQQLFGPGARALAQATAADHFVSAASDSRGYDSDYRGSRGDEQNPAFRPLVPYKLSPEGKERDVLIYGKNAALPGTNISKSTEAEYRRQRGQEWLRQHPIEAAWEKLPQAQKIFLKELQAVAEISSQFPARALERGNLPPGVASKLRYRWRAECEKLVDSYVKLDDLPYQSNIEVSIHCDVLEQLPHAHLYDVVDDGRWHPASDALACAVIEPAGFIADAGERPRDIARLDRFCRRAAERAAHGKQQYLFERAVWGAANFLSRVGRPDDALNILSHCESELAGSSNVTAQVFVLTMKATVLQQSEHDNQALDCRKQAVDKICAHEGRNSQSYAFELLRLTHNYVHLHKRQEAHATWMRAAQIMARHDLKVVHEPLFCGGTFKERLASLAECAVGCDMIEEADRMLRAAAVQPGDWACLTDAGRKLVEWYQTGYRYEEAESFMKFYAERARLQFGDRDVDRYGQALLELSAVYRHHADSPLGVSPFMRVSLMTDCVRSFNAAELCAARAYKDQFSAYELLLSRYVDNLPPDDAARVRGEFLRRQVAVADRSHEQSRSGSGDSNCCWAEPGDEFQSAATVDPQGKIPIDAFQSAAHERHRFYSARHKAQRKPGRRRRAKGRHSGWGDATAVTAAKPKTAGAEATARASGATALASRQPSNDEVCARAPIDVFQSSQEGEYAQIISDPFQQGFPVAESI